MAALTWREVSAPQMDTRGLAMAGQQIGSSFDRLGEMFTKRYDMQRDEVTDAAIARALANQDPNAKVDLTGLDPKARTKDVVTAWNSHLSSLVQREQERELLNNSQSLAKFGKYNTVRATNILSGRDEFDGISAEDRADPGFGRYLGQVDKSSLFDERIDNVEQNRSAVASEANSRISANASATSAAASAMNARTNAESAGLQNQIIRTEIATTKFKKDASVAGINVARQFASSPAIADMSYEDASKLLDKSMARQNFNEPARKAALAELGGRMGVQQARVSSELTPTAKLGSDGRLFDTAAKRAVTGVSTRRRDMSVADQVATVTAAATDQKYAVETPKDVYAKLEAAFPKGTDKWMGVNSTYLRNQFTDLIEGPNAVSLPIISAYLDSYQTEDGYFAPGTKGVSSIFAEMRKADKVYRTENGPQDSIAKIQAAVQPYQDRGAEIQRITEKGQRRGSFTPAEKARLAQLNRAMDALDAAGTRARARKYIE